MRRKLFWITGILAVWAFILAQTERRRVRLENELWAAATDPE